jgi:molecular chaperone IbpA
MRTFDLTPLYRNSIGFDRLATLLDGAFLSEQGSTGYPPYNIETLDENRYTISLAVAGFSQDELDVQVEGDVLTVKGRKSEDHEEHNYLYHGIATRGFERKFNLADHVIITGANLNNGLLTIDLKLEVPEALKPRRINIGSDASDSNVIEHQRESEKAA